MHTVMLAANWWEGKEPWLIGGAVLLLVGIFFLVIFVSFLRGASAEASAGWRADRGQPTKS